MMPEDLEVAWAAKVRAARLDKRDSEVIEDALRAHLGICVFELVVSPQLIAELAGLLA